MTVAFFAFDLQILHIFSKQESVQIVWKSALLVRCIVFLPDFSQISLQGVIRALGIQGEFVCLNLIAYWAINLPLGYALAIVFGVGYNGLWYAMLLTQSILLTFYTRGIDQADWEQISKESRKRHSTAVSEKDYKDIYE